MMTLLVVLKRPGPQEMMAGLCKFCQVCRNLTGVRLNNWRGSETPRVPRRLACKHTSKKKFLVRTRGHLEWQPQWLMIWTWNCYLSLIVSDDPFNQPKWRLKSHLKTQIQSAKLEQGRPPEGLRFNHQTRNSIVILKVVLHVERMTSTKLLREESSQNHYKLIQSHPKNWPPMSSPLRARKIQCKSLVKIRNRKWLLRRKRLRRLKWWKQRTAINRLERDTQLHVKCPGRPNLQVRFHVQTSKVFVGSIAWKVDPEPPAFKIGNSDALWHRGYPPTHTHKATCKSPQIIM